MTATVATAAAICNYDYYRFLNYGCRNDHKRCSCSCNEANAQQQMRNTSTSSPNGHQHHSHPLISPQRNHLLSASYKRFSFIASTRLHLLPSPPFPSAPPPLSLSSTPLPPIHALASHPPPIPPSTLIPPSLPSTPSSSHPPLFLPIHLHSPHPLLFPPIHPLSCPCAVEQVDEGAWQAHLLRVAALERQADHVRASAELLAREREDRKRERQEETERQLCVSAIRPIAPCCMLALGSVRTRHILCVHA